MQILVVLKNENSEDGAMEHGNNTEALLEYKHLRYKETPVFDYYCHCLEISLDFIFLTKEKYY